MSLKSRLWALSMSVILLFTATGCFNVTLPSATDNSTIDGLCGQGIPTENLSLLRVGTGTFSQPGLEWGIQQGCFAEAGLEISIQIIQNTEAAAAVSSGSLDVMLAAPQQAIVFAANGNFESRIIAADTGYSAESLERAKQEPLYPGELLISTAMLVGKDSSAKGLRDLANKKIGMNLPFGNVGRSVRMALEQAGLTEDQIEIIELPTEAIQGAIESKEIDAGILSGRYATRAVKSGLRVLAYPGAYTYIPGTLTLWMTDASTYKKKPEDIMAFRAAVEKINRLLALPENQDTWQQVLIDKLEFDPVAATETKIPQYWTKRVTLNELEQAMDLLIRVGDIKQKVPNLSSLILD